MLLYNNKIFNTRKELKKFLGGTNAYNKILRELGYTLPINSKNKINYIELIDTINNTTEQIQLQDIANQFNISVESARKQIKRTSLYKKQYKFNIVYI